VSRSYHDSVHVNFLRCCALVLALPCRRTTNIQVAICGSVLPHTTAAKHASGWHFSHFSLFDMVSTALQSPIDKLDTPCLVRVLRQLSSQQQLVACGAVCSKWRKATREATSGIDISRCTQQQCDQLQKWAVHPPAALYKLCLHGQIPRPVLRLHLSVLQHLRHLELQLVRFEAFVADGSLLTVVDLLPRLQHCTKLILRTSYNCDLIDAAAAFPAMPALQDLDIDGEDAGLPCSLVELPTTLTRLCLESLEAINPTNAATISQLTGLRVLEATTYGFDPSEEGGGQ